MQKSDIESSLHINPDFMCLFQDEIKNIVEKDNKNKHNNINHRNHEKLDEYKKTIITKEEEKYLLEIIKYFCK